jgi:reverse gyrase
MEAIYKNRCPNCGGDIDSSRLELGLFCEKCMDINEDKCKVNLINYNKFCDADEKLKKFNDFFKEKVGEELSPIQRMWSKRFFLGSSFALLAPTGIGKTTFGLLLAAFVKKAILFFQQNYLYCRQLKDLKTGI